MHQIPFLCLANSARQGGHCIAGIDLRTREWVRPVGSTGGPLTTSEVTIHGSSQQVQPFDVSLLTVGEHAPEVGQPENVTAPLGSARFHRLAESSCADPPINLSGLLHTGTDLFRLGGEKNDRLSHEDLQRDALDGSLTLILVQDPEIVSEPERRWRMGVPLGSKVHRLRVTDLRFRSRRKVGGPWVVCVSLSAAFKGFHYGLIAMATPLSDIPNDITFKTPTAGDPAL